MSHALIWRPLWARLDRKTSLPRAPAGRIPIVAVVALALSAGVAPPSHSEPECARLATSRTTVFRRGGGARRGRGRPHVRRGGARSDSPTEAGRPGQSPGPIGPQVRDFMAAAFERATAHRSAVSCSDHTRCWHEVRPPARWWVS